MKLLDRYIITEARHAADTLRAGARWADGPDGGALTLRVATGRATCRACGQRIAAGEQAIEFWLRLHTSMWRSTRCLIHAAPCEPPVRTVLAARLLAN